MNSDKKNQHFVPKFYLRNFSYLNNKKQIGLYNTRNHLYIERAKLKKQGSRDFFYGTDGIIEDGLSEIEGHLAEVIKKIIESDERLNLNQEDYLTLLTFIVLTDLRNPTRIVGFANMMNKMREKLLEESPDTDMDEVIPLPTHEECVRLSLRNCMEIVEGISDLKYKVFINKTETPFITSDHPVVKYNQYLEWRRWSHSKTGYGSMGLQIFLPLNHEKMLFLYDDSSYQLSSGNQFYFLKKQPEIDGLNLLQFLNSIETIYFDEKAKEDYLKNLHTNSKGFNKANVPFSELGYIFDSDAEMRNSERPQKRNLAINGMSECETNLTISGLKIKTTAKSKKFGNAVVLPRLTSILLKREKNSR